jgi:hypothetical protein
VERLCNSRSRSRRSVSDRPSRSGVRPNDNSDLPAYEQAPFRIEPNANRTRGAVLPSPPTANRFGVPQIFFLCLGGLFSRFLKKFAKKFLIKLRLRAWNLVAALPPITTATVPTNTSSLSIGTQMVARDRATALCAGVYILRKPRTTHGMAVAPTWGSGWIS